MNKQSDSESRLKAIIEAAMDGIISCDELGIIDSINPAACQMFEFHEDELIGSSLKVLMPDLNFREENARMYAGRTITSEEILGRKKGGDPFPLVISIRPINFEGKKFYTAVLHDITRRKSSENALQESEKKFLSVINTAVDGIILINARGYIELFNLAAVRLFQYQPEEVIGKNVNILMPEPDHTLHDSYLQNYLRTGIKKIIGIGREVTALRKDGTTFPIMLSVSEVKMKDRIIFTGIVRDITNEKMAEEQLRRYAAALERSNAELQDFAYVSSHDLQEPLRKIQSFGDRVVSREAANLSEQGKDYINRMLNAAARMQNLINDLLSFSRVTTQAKAYSKVDLNKILREVISDLEVSIEKTGTKIEVSKLPVLEAEPTQMRQLFQNLISNAIKFRKPEIPPIIKIYAKDIQRRAHLVATPGDESVEIYVQDNGIGFDEKYLDKIFNIFQRLEGQKFEGSGIGLAIVRKIAIRHGGNITAKSIPGEGSTFIVTLAKKQTSGTEQNI